MNAKRNEILRQLESKHGVRFHRRSAAIYRSEANEIGVVCTMSKWHAKNENYWYAYHPHQDKFLATTKDGYFVLGMMDLELAVVLPVEVIRQNLGKLNTTMTPDGRSYWHIHVSRSENGALSLQRAKGEPSVSVDRYMLRIVSAERFQRGGLLPSRYSRNRAVLGHPRRRLSVDVGSEGASFLIAIFVSWAGFAKRSADPWRPQER